MENKKDMEKSNDKNIGSARAYFIRGHSGYLLLLIWTLSNITILYVLLGGEMDWLYVLFPNIMIFGATFIIGYIILCVIIGYIDIEIKGVYGQEQDVYWQAIPSVQKLLKGAEDIKEVKESVEEVKSILGQIIVTMDKLFKNKEETLQDVMLEEMKFDTDDADVPKDFR